MDNEPAHHDPSRFTVDLYRGDHALAVISPTPTVIPVSTGIQSTFPHPTRLQKRIAETNDINNSDLDFCEFNGKTIITYSWGNQQGTEHLAQAEYEGSEANFLRGFFPAAK